MALDIDFFHDASNIARRRLTRLGYRIPTPISDREALMWSFGLDHRVIEATPRQLHVASTLVCPPQYQPGFQKICADIVAGTSLRPHQSTRLQDLEFDDDLLNDWGIAHLHLGTQPYKNGFLSRTPPVLFVRFTSTDAYCITIGGHGTWGDVELLRIVQREWPESIEPFKVQGAVGVAWPDGVEPDNATIKQLRSRGINSPHHIGDSVYMGPGGGFATTGRAISVVRSEMHLSDQLTRLEAWMVESEDAIRDRLRTQGQVASDPLPMTLYRDTDAKLYGHVQGTPLYVRLNAEWIFPT